MYSLHIKTSDDEDAQFDHLCEFGLVYPVLSCVVCRDNSPEAEVEARQREMRLYCMQTKAIQQYHLRYVFMHVCVYIYIYIYNIYIYVYIYIYWDE